MSRFWIPELNATILRSRHDPLVIRRKRHAEYEVLVALERPHAFTVLGVYALVIPTRHVRQLPHSDRLVQRARHQVLAARAERDRINTIFVPLLTFRPLDQHTGRRVPDAYALVETASSDKATVGGDGDGCYAVFYLKGENTLILLDVPETNCTIARARCDMASI